MINLKSLQRINGLTLSRKRFGFQYMIHILLQCLVN